MDRLLTRTRVCLERARVSTYLVYGRTVLEAPGMGCSSNEACSRAWDEKKDVVVMPVCFWRWWSVRFASRSMQKKRPLRSALMLPSGLAQFHPDISGSGVS